MIASNASNAATAIQTGCMRRDRRGGGENTGLSAPHCGQTSIRLLISMPQLLHLATFMGCTTPQTSDQCP